MIKSVIVKGLQVVVVTAECCAIFLALGILTKLCYEVFRLGWRLIP
jgi:hypothetical protein